MNNEPANENTPAPKTDWENIKTDALSLVRGVSYGIAGCFLLEVLRRILGW
jgi:hypothetical protein